MYNYVGVGPPARDGYAARGHHRADVPHVHRLAAFIENRRDSFAYALSRGLANVGARFIRSILRLSSSL